MLENNLSEMDFQREDKELLWPLTGESLEKQYLEIVLAIKHPFSSYKLTQINLATSNPYSDLVKNTDNIIDFSVDKNGNKSDLDSFKIDAQNPTQKHEVISEAKEEAISQETEDVNFFEHGIGLDFNSLNLLGETKEDQIEGAKEDIEMAQFFEEKAPTEKSQIGDFDMSFLEEKAPEEIPLQDVNISSIEKEEATMEEGHALEELASFSQEEHSLEGLAGSIKDSFLEGAQALFADRESDEPLNDMSFTSVSDALDIKDEDNFDSLTNANSVVSVHDFNNIEENKSIVGEEIEQKEQTNELEESINKIAEMQQRTQTEDEKMFVNKNELVELLLYIDMIMRELPLDVKDDFEKSKYYVLYNKLFDELGI